MGQPAPQPWTSAEQAGKAEQNLVNTAGPWMHMGGGGSPSFLVPGFPVEPPHPPEELSPYLQDAGVTIDQQAKNRNLDTAGA